MSMVAIPISRLPKRNYQPAAVCTANLDVLAVRINAQPRRYFLKAGRGWYTILGMQLSSGRFATLCRWDDFPESIEVSLELMRETFFYETDLQEILDALAISMSETSRQGAYSWRAK